MRTAFVARPLEFGRTLGVLVAPVRVLIAQLRVEVVGHHEDVLAGELEFADQRLAAVRPYRVGRIDAPRREGERSAPAGLDDAGSGRRAVHRRRAGVHE